MRLKNLDLILVTVVVVLNVIWTQIPGHVPVVGSLLALPLVLFLPGYTLTQMLHCWQEQSSGVHDLIQQPERQTGYGPDRANQFVLSLGLSVTIDVLVGFGLNILPFGLQQSSWVLSLGFLTTLFVIGVALLRQKNMPVPVEPPPVVRHVHMQNAFQASTLFALAICVGSSAVWLALVRPLNPQPSFTQFWILPADQAKRTCGISIGIHSFETTREIYHVTMAINETPAHSWSAIVLPPSQKWAQPVVLTPGSASNLFIEARLYRADRPDTVYRSVHLTFIVSKDKRNSAQKQCTLRE